MAENKKKILYTSVAIRPNKGGSVIITENLAKQFGSDEMVVLGSKRPFGTTEKREGGPSFYYQLGEVNLKGRGDRFFVPIRYLLFPFLLLRIYRILKKDGCNYILANFPDIFYCYASYLVAKWTKTNFSIYMHNTYLENRESGHRNFFAKRWQPKIFDYADSIFVMSDGMKQYFEKKYNLNKKIVALPHIQGYGKPKQFKVIPQGKSLNMVLIGNFNDSNIEATKRFVAVVGNMPDVKLHFYTHVPKSLLSLRGVDVSKIEMHGYVNDWELLEELDKYDVCVLTHGFIGNYSSVEYNTIFPTRTIPFLMSGKPIIIHSPPNVFITDFFKQNDCGLVVDSNNPDDLKQLVIEFLIDANVQQRVVENAQGLVDMFDGAQIKKKLLNNL